MGVENKFERSLREAADVLCLRHGDTTYLGEICLRRIQDNGGGWTCDLPLRLAAQLKKDAQHLVNELIDHLNATNFLWEVSASPNSELNMTSGNKSDGGLGERVRQIVANADPRLKTKIVLDLGAPRGSLRLGQVCLALFCDTLAHMLRTIGRPVALEFRVDDNPEHLGNLGRSIKTRYLKELGYCTLMPEGGLLDGFLVFVARELKKDVGHTLSTEYSSKPFAAYGLKRILKHWQEELESVGIVESEITLRSDAVGSSNDYSSRNFEKAWGEAQAKANVASIVAVSLATGRSALQVAGQGILPVTDLPLTLSEVKRNNRTIDLVDPRGDILTLTQVLKELGPDGLREFALDHVVLKA